MNRKPKKQIPLYQDPIFDDAALREQGMLSRQEVVQMRRELDAPDRSNENLEEIIKTLFYSSVITLFPEQIQDPIDVCANRLCKDGAFLAFTNGQDCSAYIKQFCQEHGGVLNIYTDYFPTLIGQANRNLRNIHLDCTRENYLIYDTARDCFRMSGDAYGSAEYEQDSVSSIFEKMIQFYDGDAHDVEHMTRVWTYARMLGEQEHLPPAMQKVLEIAALLHDIACPLCREKYGNTDGKHQEREGAVLARKFLKNSGLPQEHIDRVVFLVGHHHTLQNIEGMDWQILVEADYIANALENGYDAKEIRNFANKVAKTFSGKRFIVTLFQC